MKTYVVCTSYNLDGDSFTKSMSVLDGTFSERYVEKNAIKSEDHWEADKYRLFYIAVEDTDREHLVKLASENRDFYVVAEVNARYEILGDPLFETNKFGWKGVPQNLTAREDGFKPR